MYRPVSIFGKPIKPRFISARLRDAVYRLGLTEDLRNDNLAPLLRMDAVFRYKRKTLVNGRTRSEFKAPHV